MRWGILVNLAVILAVSGLLLFAVFGASLEHAAIDLKIQQANVIVDLLHDQILASDTPEHMWERVRTVCRGHTGIKLLLYDSGGHILGGCSAGKELEPPDTREPGRRVKIIGARWPSSLFRGTVVLADFSGAFPHGVRAVRTFLEIPSTTFAPSWKFFGAYLILTQAALFFLGYILFNRTVLGPVREAARLAGRASGITDSPDPFALPALKGDIQRISSSLKAMIVKIVDDREKMQALINQLKAINHDLEAAQQGLIRSEKLAGVGRLAAGVAHEIGNPLQIVMGYVELLSRDPNSDSETEVLSRMDQELKRIHDILQRLLEFARPIPENIIISDINALVKDCASLVQGRKGFDKVEFEFQLAPDLPLLKTEPEKIRQVIVNLVFNAADAIPQSGGKIILRTHKDDSAAQIEVEDTGSGISQENLTKVFDPFFTTKEPGKGTGLGLAVCLGLVESMGGTINIESEEGKGTLVSVRIPRVEG
ncbi:MAG: ATP-binding protein [Desulfomonilaceae bacterium]